MKSTEKCQDLRDALINNTVVTSITLKNCEIGDDGAAFIAEALEKNDYIEVMDLSDNKIRDQGAIRLAQAFTTNVGLRELNLMGMVNLGKSERVLSAFIDAYQENLTLAKIVWRLDHRLAHTLARLITRNNSIRHRIEQEKPFQDLVPDGLKSKHNVVLGRRGSTGTAAELASAMAEFRVSNSEPNTNASTPEPETVTEPSASNTDAAAETPEPESVVEPAAPEPEAPEPEAAPE